MNKKEIIDLLDKWLGVLNYWDSDVADCAERNNSMNWYKRYENTQNEMYNLWYKLTHK